MELVGAAGQAVSAGADVGQEFRAGKRVDESGVPSAGCASWDSGFANRDTPDNCTFVIVKQARLIENQVQS